MQNDAEIVLYVLKETIRNTLSYDDEDVSVNIVCASIYKDKIEALIKEKEDLQFKNVKIFNEYVELRNAFVEQYPAPIKLKSITRPPALPNDQRLITDAMRKERDEIRAKNNEIAEQNAENFRNWSIFVNKCARDQCVQKFGNEAATILTDNWFNEINKHAYYSIEETILI